MNVATQTTVTVGHRHARRHAASRTPTRRSGESVSRLMAAAAHGDQCAWNGLVVEFSGLIWAIARAHRLTKADGADVAQTCWLALVEHLERVKDPACVGGWLATTARRECLRVLRDNDRSLPLGDDEREDESTDLALGEAVLRRERDLVLWNAFARLPSRDQALLRMLVADPRPAYDEIAAALEMPIGSIGPTRQRALERLRQELDREGSLALMTR